MHKNSGMDIYVLVGHQVKAATAYRITAGGVAIVASEHGPLEFGAWFRTRDKAESEAKLKLKPSKRRLMSDNVEVMGAGTASAGTQCYAPAFPCTGELRGRHEQYGDAD